MRALVLASALVAAMAGAAHAQPASVFGKALPGMDLPGHTLAVRVIAGSVVKPVVGIVVTLTGDGKPRTAKTDAAGRAKFTTSAGAHVRASVATTDAKAIAKSDELEMPDDIGVRVILSTVQLPPDPPPSPDDGAPADYGKPFAIDKACVSDRPAQEKETLVGKPLPKVIADKLGAALRGKPLLLNLGGTFNCSFAAQERASLTVRAAAKDIAVVQIMSAEDAKDLAACVGDKPGYTTILDVPAKDAAIGPLTGALGITAVPETLIVDGKGVVRFHYIGAHDFASPELARCVATIAR